MTPKRLILLATALFVVALAGIAALALLPRGARQFDSTDVTGVAWGKGFQLVDDTGHPRSLADFHGKVVALFFGYTNCTDVCPTALAKLAQARRLLGEAGNGVQVLFATVDPQRDTPHVLAQYVKAFDPSFVGLYGDPATTERTAKEFKVYYSNAPQKATYVVEHTDRVFVFDRDGRLRLMMDPELAPTSMAHDLGLLLK